MYLFESSKEDFFEYIKQYAKKDNKNRPEYFIRFTKIEKFGPNPSDFDPSDPFGIYGFPLGVFKKEIGKAGSYEELMEIIKKYEEGNYFVRFPYVYVFRTTPDANIWYLKQEPLPRGIIDLKSFIKKFVEHIKNKYPETAVERFLTEPRQHFYIILRNLMSLLFENDIDASLAFTKFLRKYLKLDGVVDNKGKIINTQEPYQGVFFNYKKIEIMKLIHNPIGMKIKRISEHPLFSFFEKKDLKNYNTESVIKLFDSFRRMHSRGYGLTEKEKRFFRSVLNSNLDSDVKKSILLYSFINDITNSDVFIEKENIYEEYLSNPKMHVKWMMELMKNDYDLDKPDSIGSILKNMLHTYIISLQNFDFGEISRYMKSLPEEEKNEKLERLMKIGKKFFVHFTRYFDY